MPTRSLGAAGVRWKSGCAPCDSYGRRKAARRKKAEAAREIISAMGKDHQTMLTSPVFASSHAAGTRAMMTAALEGLTRPDGTRPLLIAVTQLTSTDQQALRDELLIDRPMDEVVMEYITTVLEGKVTAEMYGEPRGSAVQILPEAEEEAEEEPAA